LPLNLELATPSYRYWEKWVETFFFHNQNNSFRAAEADGKKMVCGMVSLFFDGSE
jgi:hypothetical protein